MTISDTYTNELKELERVQANLALSGLHEANSWNERNSLLGGGLVVSKHYETKGRRSVLTYNPRWSNPAKPARKYRYCLWPTQYNTSPWTLGWLYRNGIITDYEQDGPRAPSLFDPWWHSIPKDDSATIFTVESDWGYAKYICNKLVLNRRYYDVIISSLLLEAKGGISPEAKGIWWDAEEQAWRGRAPARLKRWMRLGGLHLLPPPSKG